MFYAQINATKKDPAAVVYIVAFQGDGENAIVLTKEGRLLRVNLADLTVADANRQTPYSNWPEPVAE